jgi:hypothetical protein
MVRVLLMIAGFAAVLLVVLGIGAAVQGHGAAAVPIAFGIALIAAMAWLQRRVAAKGGSK